MEDAQSNGLIDDDNVVVTKWTLPPNSETGFHTHSLDYVVVYLDAGELTVTAENGEKIVAPVQAHDVTSRPAGITHNVANQSNSAIRFIEIELKR